MSLRPLRPELHPSIDSCIASDPRLETAWAELEKHLEWLTDIDNNPTRPRCLHMDHGMHHWRRVAEVAEVAWRSLCRTHPAWWSSESAFLLKAACFLHDIANVNGIPQGFKLHRNIKRGFDVDGRRCAVNDLDDSEGQFLLRRKQAEIAAATVRQLFAEKKLGAVNKSTARRLEALVGHYHKMSPKLASLSRRLHPAQPERIEAIAASVQFADWFHMDRSRVQTVTLEEVERKVLAELEALVAMPSTPVRLDGGLPCVLAKLLRSHYVFAPSAKPSDDARLRISMRVAKPPEVDQNTAGGMMRELRRQLRTKLFPSRFEGHLVGDHFERWGVHIEYREPVWEDPSEIEGYDFRNPPPVARDFWTAGNWFNLDEAAQFKLPNTNPVLATEIRWPVVADALYSSCAGVTESRYCGKPILSRRAFIWVHLNVTNGESLVAEPFFRQLHHNVCCGHIVSEYGHYPGGKTLVQCLAETLKTVQGAFYRAEFQQAAGANEEFDWVLGCLAKRFNKRQDRLNSRYQYWREAVCSIAALERDVVERGLKRRAVGDAVRALTKADAVACVNDQLSLRRGTRGSAALLLLSALQRNSPIFTPFLPADQYHPREPTHAF